MKNLPILWTLLVCLTCSWSLAQSDEPGASEARGAALIAGTGSRGHIPLWKNNTELGNSTIFESTSGSTAGYIGIGTTTPATPLYVNAPVSAGYIATFNNTLSATNTALFITTPDAETGIGVDQNGGSFVYSSTGSFYIGPNLTDTLWVGEFGCGNNCNGKVGMQTNTPQNPLDVRGSVAIGSFGGENAAPPNGLIVSGYVGIGTPSPSNLLTLVQGGGPALSDGWNTYSSRRFKTNIHPLLGALERVEHLQGVSYDRKNDGRHEIGVIAEDVSEVVPEVVSRDPNTQEIQGVDYSRLTALLVEAVKAQQREIEELQAEVRQLTSNK